MNSTIWTILPESTWLEFQKRKILIPEIKHVEQEFLEGYNWMKLWMNKLIGQPRIRMGYPCWSWYQYLDSRRRRPDLRSSGFLPKNTIGYRVELNKSNKEILLSDFELWHYVLNKWYLPESEEDAMRFETENQSKYGDIDSQSLFNLEKSKIVKSWERIFDMNFCAENISMPFEEKSIQATFWELKFEEIVNVDRFTAM